MEGLTATLRPHRPQPPPEERRAPLPQRLTSRRRALAVPVLALVLVGPVSAVRRSAEGTPRGDAVPAGGESAVVADQLETFPDSDRAPVLLVAAKGGQQLSPQDLAALEAMAGQLDTAGGPSSA